MLTIAVMIDGQLLDRKTSDTPPIYRVTFDDRMLDEVGSIAERMRNRWSLLALGLWTSGERFMVEGVD